MFDAEYFCNPNVFTFLFNKRHLYNSVSRGCFSVSLDKMRIINKENKCDVISPLQNKSPIHTLKSEMCKHIQIQIIKHINDVQS